MKIGNWFARVFWWPSVKDIKGLRRHSVSSDTSIRNELEQHTSIAVLLAISDWVVKNL